MKLGPVYGTTSLGFFRPRRIPEMNRVRRDMALRQFQAHNYRLALTILLLPVGYSLQREER